MFPQLFFLFSLRKSDFSGNLGRFTISVCFISWIMAFEYWPRLTNNPHTCCRSCTLFCTILIWTIMLLSATLLMAELLSLLSTAKVCWVQKNVTWHHHGKKILTKMSIHNPMINIWNGLLHPPKRLIHPQKRLRFHFPQKRLNFPQKKLSFAQQRLSYSQRSLRFPQILGKVHSQVTQVLRSVNTSVNGEITISDLKGKLATILNKKLPTLTFLWYFFCPVWFLGRFEGFWGSFSSNGFSL